MHQKPVTTSFNYKIQQHQLNEITKKKLREANL